VEMRCPFLSLDKPGEEARRHEEEFEVYAAM
jgi:hypothetical protein